MLHLDSLAPPRLSKIRSAHSSESPVSHTVDDNSLDET
jgi:hypothetical protein